MNNYFVAKIKREKIEESGKVKVVTEEYIFDAISWTECEARIATELAPYFKDYTIKDISRSNYSEVFDTEGESYFKCKISYVTICEEKGTEKKTASYVLVMGDDLKTARENLVEAMSGTIVDYEINSIADTRVEDVFPYSADSVASAVPEHLTPEIIKESLEEDESEVTYEYGIMSSKNKLRATNKLTAYAAMVLHYNANTNLIIIYTPEESKKDIWANVGGETNEILDKLYGGDGCFEKYLENNKAEIKACFDTIEEIQ